MTRWNVRPVALADLVDHVLSLGHLAEDRVVAPVLVVVEPRHGHVGDEELAAVGVLPAVGHRQDARLVEEQISVRLVVERVARPPSAGPGGVAALGHEGVDDAVERQAVVEMVLREVEEARHGDGRVRGEERQVNVALVGVEGDVDVLHGRGGISRGGRGGGVGLLRAGGGAGGEGSREQYGQQGEEGRGFHRMDGPTIKEDRPSSTGGGKGKMTNDE